MQIAPHYYLGWPIDLTMLHTTDGSTGMLFFFYILVFAGLLCGI